MYTAAVFMHSQLFVSFPIADQKYCLYPECVNEKDPSLCTVNPKYPTPTQSHFCNQNHQFRARIEG